MDDKIKNQSTSKSANDVTEADIINWQEKFKEMQAQRDILKNENERLARELEECRNGHTGSNLPSKEEIDSISSMIDIINKLDDNTINKIERLNRSKHD